MSEYYSPMSCFLGINANAKHSNIWDNIYEFMDVKINYSVLKSRQPKDDSKSKLKFNDIAMII